MLEVKHVKFGYSKKHLILKDISFSLPPGHVLSLLGSNGTGKTTLMRCILGLLKPTGGEILFDGHRLNTMSAARRSTFVAYVPQFSRLTFPYTVKEVVMMGRTGHFGLGRAPSKIDYEAVDHALAQMNITKFGEKMFQELSGGEKQLVLISRAIAQDARLLILDEPTSSLDFANQCRTLELIERLASDGYTVLMTTHSPDQAFWVSSYTVLLKNGLVFADGKVEDVITSKNLTNLYEMPINVLETSVKIDGNPLKVCVPLFNEAEIFEEETEELDKHQHSKFHHPHTHHK